MRVQGNSDGTGRVRRRRISDAQRHALAVRDGLAWWLWGRFGPMWVYECAVCARLMQPGLATAGHITPLSEGGTYANHNLRLECTLCNVADNVARHLPNRGDLEGRLRQIQDRFARKRLARHGTSEVFSNVPVYWNARHLSFTSRRNARHFVAGGLAEEEPSGGICLRRPPKNQETASAEAISNECARCGVKQGLLRFAQHPYWHPANSRSRPSETDRPVCVNCVSVFEIGYALEITNVAFAAIIAAWEGRNRCRRRKAVALETWSRRRSNSALPAETRDSFARDFDFDPAELSLRELEGIATTACLDSNEAERAAFKAVGRRLIEAGLDFPSLFHRLADPESVPVRADLPGIPLAIAEGQA
jgi:hypothetical protein